MFHNLPRTIAVVALLLCVSVNVNAQQDELDRVFTKILEENEISPDLFPREPFLPTELDPMLIKSQWDMIRGQIEAECQRVLRLERKPFLGMAFKAVDASRTPNMLRIVLADPDHAAIRASIGKVLGCPEDGFSKAVQRHCVAMVPLGNLRKEYKSEDSCNFAGLGWTIITLCG
jgi:hypothetical protein